MRVKRGAETGDEASGRRRRQRSCAAISVLLGAVALAAGACSSSPASPTTTTAPTTTTSSGTTTSDGGTPSLTKIETELAVGAPTFIATYNYTNIGGNGSYVVAHDGSDGLVAIHDNGGKIEQIALGSKTYFCAVGGGSGAACFFGPASKHLGLEFTDIFALIGAKAALTALRTSTGPSDISPSTVDGHAAFCVKSQPEASKTVTVCVLSDGVLAEFETQTASSTRKVVLSSISTTVPSDEFTLPATPTTIPSGIQ